MPWNAVSPTGSISVKANRTPMNQNTTYIETTMGNSIVGTNTAATRDHFWNVGSDEDGRHRFIQSPAFTVGGLPTDPVLGTGMDDVLYAKTTNATVQWFHRNVGGVYQVTPTVLKAAMAGVLSTSYSTVIAVPANTYGEIYLYISALVGANTFQYGNFRAGVAQVDTFSSRLGLQGSGSNSLNVKFGNGGEASGLNIMAKRDQGEAGNTWTYIVKYWTL